MTKLQAKQFTKGVLWSAIERFSVQGVQFLLTLVIARLVLPNDYGLIAMLNIFLAVAGAFVDSGFSNALIQKQDRTETDFATVFYFNMIVAVALYGILWITAPLIAGFYEQPLLIPVLRWLSLVLPVNALAIIQNVKFTIALDFKISAKVSLISVVVSGIVGIVMAWYGMGVWALVAQALCNALFKSVLLWIFIRWRVQWSFSWASFRRLFPFGSRLLGVTLLHVLYNDMYTLVIGKKFSPAQVGFFNYANNFARFPSQNLSAVFARVSYPVMCRLQDDNQALCHELIRHLRMTVFIIFPLMAFLGVLAEPTILVLLTEKWLPVAPLLVVLCVAYVLDPVRSLNWQMLNVKGRSDMALRVEIISKIVSIAILFASIPFGVKAMCWGLAVSTLTDIVIIDAGVRRVTGIRLRREIRELLPIAGLTLLASVAAWGSAILVEAPLSKIVMGLIVGTFIYISGAWMARFQELQYFINLIIRRR